MAASRCPRTDRESGRGGHRLGALLMVVLLLSGCATGTPVGFRLAASGIHYRAAVEYDAPREQQEQASGPHAQAGPDGTKSREDGEDCGEPEEAGTSAEDSPAVRLEASEAFTPRATPVPVKLDAEALREALAELVLQVRLSVGSYSVPASASGGGEALDGLYQHLWRDKGLWCQPGQSPREDGCLSLLERGFSLDRFDRLKLAVGFSMDTVLDGVAVTLGETFSPKVLGGLVVGFLASYLLMLAAPEPVFTKGLALVLTLYLAAYLGTGPFQRMVLASRELVDASRQATTFTELEEAGQRFGRVLGEDGARVVLLLLMAALGGKQGLLGRGPTLPGFTQAAAVAQAQWGVRLVVVAEVQSVAITATGGLAVRLTPSAMAMVAQGPSSGAVQPLPTKSGYWHHIATDKFFKSTRNGGPWSQRFERLFAKAGMQLSDKANRVYIRGHKGPHPQAYHEQIHERLRQAVEGCTTTQQCRRSLVQELRKLAEELTTEGSPLNRLLTE